MYCPNCGINLNDKNLNFCPNCGNKISNTVESQSTNYITVSSQPPQVNAGGPGFHSKKCLGFALTSLIMGIVTGVIGLFVILRFGIVGSIILLAIHIIGLKFGNSAKEHSKKAAELELPNPTEKVGSVFSVFGIVINAILLVLAIIFTVIFFIIILSI